MIERNTRVLMKPRMAKWYLDHTEVYDSPRYNDINEITNFDVDMQICMLCCMGEPVEGYVKMQGIDQDTFGVVFFVEGLSMFTFVDKGDVKWPSQKQRS